MNSPFISVIVPIYNAEKTLSQCMNSLKAQTFMDFEVLLIDDGSPDRCGEMIDAFAQEDSRFKAFHKQNGGVSSARQYGLDHAKGEYTIHADPDDWVEPTMLEELYRKAKEDDADMVICDFFENTYKGQKYVKQQPSALDHLTLQKELFQQLHGSCCNKLVRRVCYSEYDVRFPDNISFCEDQYVNCALLMNDLKVTYLPKAFYHYVRNDVQSLSRRYTSTTFDEDCERKRLFVELLADSQNSACISDVLDLVIMSRAFWGGLGVFSSKDYRHHFAQMRNLIADSAWSSFQKVLVFLSCSGFYQPVRGWVEALLKVKHFILKGH